MNLDLPKILQFLFQIENHALYYLPFLYSDSV